LLRLDGGREPFRLELGGRLAQLDVAFETYGSLSSKRDNAILITHALAADSHVAGDHEPGDRPGWWNDVVGTGRPIDTDRFFVICPNILGSCHGTTGPSSMDPLTGAPYGPRFPRITVGDWVTVHARLLDALGIERLFAVAGGSIGGQQALEFALRFPDRVSRAVVVAAAARLSAQGLAFNACGRTAIVNDPNFSGGDYYGKDHPTNGLSAARMMANITYLSEEGMRGTFGRRLRESQGAANEGLETEFAVEEYVAQQGRRFAAEFDANSYLAISRAMDHYDAAAWGGGDLLTACERIKAPVLLLSFDSDWLYPPKDCRELALALIRAGKRVHHANIPSPHGHDSFLLGSPMMNSFIHAFLDG
jgi:homoserine O-acetyltransferase